MSHRLQIVEDFREAVAGISAERIDNHIYDLERMRSALIVGDEASLKKVIESPRWMISGDRLNRLCISAQLFQLNFPNDWVEGFTVSEDRWQLPRGVLTRLLTAWRAVQGEMGG